MNFSCYHFHHFFFNLSISFQWYEGLDWVIFAFPKSDMMHLQTENQTQIDNMQYPVLIKGP